MFCAPDAVPRITLTSPAVSRSSIQNAASDEVKKYGQQLVTDHTAAGQKATAAAEQMGVTPPTEPSRKQKSDHAKMSKMTGEAFDRAFVYGKLGAVWGKFDYDSLFSSTFTNTTVTGSATIVGVLIGVGFEYALTDNWTTKFEYNYIDYGNKIVEFTSTTCTALGCDPSTTFRETVKERKQLAKLGVSYKFGYAEPAVRARY